MFSIVIVSHSRKLAQSLASLASEVSSVKIPVSYSGGAGGSDDVSGTDATDILTAIESVYTDEGVIVFTDIGSSILSAEFAHDLLDDEKKEHVFISKAPLVEGVLSAAVQCASGSGISFALSEAKNSLSMKKGSEDAADIPLPADISLPVDQGDQNKEKHERNFIIRNLHGLHARPASAFVKAVVSSGCNVEVNNITTGKGPANGKSLNQLALLEILKSHEISVSAQGDNSEKLLKELQMLIENNFGEIPENIPAAKSAASVLKSAGEKYAFSGETPESFAKHFVFSEGIGIGPVYSLPEISIDVHISHTDNSAAELELLESAISRVKKNILLKIEKLLKNLKSEEADILKAHLVILEDPDLYDKSISLIKEKKYSASYAFSKCAGEIINQYKGMKDPYLKMREADVRDAVHQVLNLLGATDELSFLFYGIPEKSIIAASDLTPSAVLKLYNKKAAGLILSRGSRLSHAAIIARSLGIPGIGGYVNGQGFKNKDIAAIDGYSGEVFINPGKDITDSLLAKKKQKQEKTAVLLDAAGKDAESKDGVHIPVYANISSAEEAQIALLKGADGVGVIRTEFLFIHSEKEPTEDEQYNYFNSIFTAMGKQPVTVRTFDIGGDKKVLFVEIPDEENPYLGRRGIRLYDSNPLVIKRQLRSILKAGIGHNIQIMLPMVSRQSEVTGFKKDMLEVHSELVKESIPHLWPVPVGIMIETPSSVLMADELAEVSDFFSIGTNDLTQYIMAAERGSSDLSSWADPFDPAVLRCIRIAAGAGKKKGIPVSLCGEMGADPDAVSLILGLGITSISAGPDSIPLIKHIISSISISDGEKLALDIIKNAKTPSDVRKILQTGI
ncbi:MAG: phosphoenolpyruvate--protein phosphotransferase [Spirochaetia bacterium]|jgi:phosphocarrier protein FPr|nr:phosphoenolpyruvate--protein phosphotransferase [Spirochaetia bacterium]